MKKVLIGAGVLVGLGLGAIGLGALAVLVIHHDDLHRRHLK